MMQDSPLWTDVAQVVILGAQLVLLGVAAFVAWRQVEEARRLREEQSRPFVVMDFDTEGALLFLTVSNIGTSLARDVRFEIEPRLSSAVINTLDEMKMLRDGISTLAPGKTIRTLFDSAIQRNETQLPDTYRVVTRYSDQDGRRHFEEATDLDLGIYWGLMRVDRKGLHDVHERLKEMRDVFRKWTASTGAVRHISPGELRQENERRLREYEERQQPPEDAG